MEKSTTLEALEALKDAPPGDLGEQVAIDRIDLKASFEGALAAAGAADLALLRAIRSVDLSELWRADGARSAPEWIAAQTGFSRWKASRWVAQIL